MPVADRSFTWRPLVIFSAS